jgi:hypothetical protein
MNNAGKRPMTMHRAVSTLENASKSPGLIAVLLPRGEAEQGSVHVVE